MKILTALAVLAVATVALAQDRPLTVLEVSVVVRGGDWHVTADGGCESIRRIDPIADQRATQTRAMPKALCDSLKLQERIFAKMDQGVGDGGVGR